MDDPDSYLFHSLWFIQETFAGSELDIFSLSIQFLVIILSLLFSALFSGAEVAFFSLPGRIDDLRNESETSRNERILEMITAPRRLLATILIGNTFANIVASVLAAVMTGTIVAYYGFPEGVVFTAEVIVLTFTILILSEITPKLIAINDPVKVSRKLYGFVYFFYILLKPLAKTVAKSTALLEEKLPKPVHKMTSDDIMTMAEVSEQEGSIKSEEREIIENVIEFGTTSVREIMTSRTNIVAVSTEDTLQDVLSLIRDKGLSRMPLYENDLDNILGIIYAKDVLPYLHTDLDHTTMNWRTIARQVLFIPATKKLDNLLRDFQQEKTHIAIVVDEYGGTEGLVTLDDILEEIVGELADEYDEGEEKLYTAFKNGIYIFDAKIDLDDMEEVLGCEMTSEEDDFETLGGLIYHLTERIPNVGERVYYKGIEFTIHSVHNNRVRKLRIKVMPDARRIKRTKVSEE